MVTGRAEQQVFETHQGASDQGVVGLIERLDVMHPMIALCCRWSCRLRPTPGLSATVAMPSSPSQSAGPTPESWRIWGEPTEPARQDDLAFRTDFDRASMLPVSDTYARLPSNSTFSTKTPVSMRRLLRCRIGFRNRVRRPAEAVLLIDVEVARSRIIPGIEVRRGRIPISTAALATLSSTSHWTPGCSTRHSPPTP